MSEFVTERWREDRLTAKLVQTLAARTGQCSVSPQRSTAGGLLILAVLVLGVHGLGLAGGDARCGRKTWMRT